MLANLSWGKWIGILVLWGVFSFLYGFLSELGREAWRVWRKR